MGTGGAGAHAGHRLNHRGGGLSLPVVDTTVYFNPACSNCRTTQSLLREHGVEAEYVEYLVLLQRPIVIGSALD